MGEILGFDVVEQILVRLDVEDLTRCKSVCKSWQYLISSPPFVKAHLNRSLKSDRDNPELGHRRICLSFDFRDDGSSFYRDDTHIVGSCNGLVCVSPEDVVFEVTNPSTGVEIRQLPKPPYPPRPMIRLSVECWGFGYDSSADDYKIVVGFINDETKHTLFQVFTFKSYTWKPIPQVIKYTRNGGISGTLCGGALHWLMTNRNTNKSVIISLDLSTEEFKEIPLPPKLSIESDYYRLGVTEERLCVCSYLTPYTSKKWVMKNDDEWELVNNDHCQSKYDVVHILHDLYVSYYLGDIRQALSNGDYIWDSIFVKSLVSPHPHFYSNKQNHEGVIKGQEAGNASVRSVAKANKRKRKRNMRRKWSCSYKRPLVWI